MTKLLPAGIVRRVVEKLYRDAQRVGWLNLTPRDRNRQYTTWLDNQEVGGLLLRFVKRDGARVWIKDGPMKEYARALAGVGRFKDYASGSGASPDRVVRAAVGKECTVLKDSVGIKPLHCLTENKDGEQTWVCWGPPKDFKHLLWAAICRAVDASDVACHVVVIESVERTTDAAEQRRRLALAAHCKVGVSHLRLD